MRHAARVRALLAALAVAACSSPAPDAASGTARPTEAVPEPGSRAGGPSASAAEPLASWAELEDAPLARLEMATAAHRGRIWMAGGLSPLGEAVSEVEVFDPATGEWTRGPTLPDGVHHAALVSDGDRLWLVGGYVGASFATITDRVLVLDEGSETWTEGPPLPEPRAAGAATWDGARIVYGGGVGPGGVTGDVIVLAEGSWTEIGALPRPREHLAATSDGAGRAWLLGGRVGGLDANLADVAVVEGGSITPLDPLPTARGGVAAFYVPTIGACLSGGEAPAEAYAVVECVGDDGTIVTAPPMNVRRHGHGAAVVDGAAYVLLGGPAPGLSTHASVERLDVVP